MTPDELWNNIKDCFQSDEDGHWVPTVELQGLSEDEVSDIYLWIRSTSRLVNVKQCFWHEIEHRSLALDDVQDPARLVAAGDAAPFSFAVEGIRIADAELPLIGVEVFQTTIGFNYSTSDSWGPIAVYGFISMLFHLIKRTKNGYLSLDTMGPPLNPERFLEAWNIFRSDE